MIYSILLASAAFCAAISMFAWFGYARIAPKLDAAVPGGKALRRVLSVFVPSGRYDSNGTTRIVNAVGVLAAIVTILLLAFVVNGLVRDGLGSSQ